MSDCTWIKGRLSESDKICAVFIEFLLSFLFKIQLRLFVLKAAAMAPDSLPLLTGSVLIYLKQKSERLKAMMVSVSLSSTGERPFVDELRQSDHPDWTLRSSCSLQPPREPESPWRRW